ncbi:protein of unknown function (plasmid) [Cupriavidus neocaledonicus]|uniref:Uncharacterized protein n=1 Tax=Cupriavidus neocaledonicus TaxID=1040979 RepID=A0A375HT89_9BURK|nr:protein of unknown function [Cupriavidus neocaledonicus]
MRGRSLSSVAMALRLGLRIDREIGSFRKVLSQEPVRIFVRAALPRILFARSSASAMRQVGKICGRLPRMTRITRR